MRMGMRIMMMMMMDDGGGGGVLSTSPHLASPHLAAPWFRARGEVRGRADAGVASC